MSHLREVSTNYNQFVLGPEFVYRDCWTCIELSESLRISAHPGLAVRSVNAGNYSLTLIGFMLDWAHPERTDDDILGSLLSNTHDFDTCWQATAELGGRWILIFQDETSSCLFHDAAGHRQVCYTQNGKVWCASQPGLLTEQLDIQPETEAVNFIEWCGKKDPQYWWPGERLAFSEMRALLPNHALDLESGKTFRYWPDSRLNRLQNDEACQRLATRLRGMMAAATNRFDVALGLSAGWDSRILLAAARPFLHKLAIYNGRGSSASADKPDIVIPDQLARQFGFDLDIIVEKEQLDSSFADEYYRHNWLAHPHFASGMQADFEYSRRQKVAVIGNVSEIGKLPYRGKLDANQRIDGPLLSEFYWGGHAWAAKALTEWIESMAELKGLNPLDLFYWEQRLGRWLAGNSIEFDFAWKDILAPFNIRGLMVDLLSTDEEIRRPPTHDLYRQLIQSLWPELLQKPINPTPRPRLLQRLKSFGRRAVARSKFLQGVRSNKRDR